MTGLVHSHQSDTVSSHRELDFEKIVSFVLFIRSVSDKVVSTKKSKNDIAYLIGNRRRNVQEFAMLWKSNLCLMILIIYKISCIKCYQRDLRMLRFGIFLLCTQSLVKSTPCLKHASCCDRPPKSPKHLNSLYISDVTPDLDHLANIFLLYVLCT